MKHSERPFLVYEYPARAYRSLWECSKKFNSITSLIEELLVKESMTQSGFLHFSGHIRTLIFFYFISTKKLCVNAGKNVTRCFNNAGFGKLMKTKWKSWNLIHAIEYRRRGTFGLWGYREESLRTNMKACTQPLFDVSHFNAENIVYRDDE